MLQIKLAELGIMTAEAMPIDSGAAEFGSDRIGPQALMFLRQATGPYVAENQELQVLPRSAGIGLSDQLINAYLRCYRYMLKSHDQKWLAVAEDNAAMAKRFVRDEDNLSAIAADYSKLGSPRVAELRILETIPKWLHRAADARLLNIEDTVRYAIAVPEVYAESGDSSALPEQKRRLSLVPAPAEEDGMNAESYEQWLDLRDTHYQSLSYLANLALAANLIHRPSPTEIATRQQISDSISRILELHNNMAHGDADGHAISGLVNPERDLERISALTARVAWIWERSWQRTNDPGADWQERHSPFDDLPLAGDIRSVDFARPEVQLVVETATAVGAMLGAGYAAGKPDSQFNRHVATFIAKRGPDWALHWIRGDIIRDYCAQQGSDAEEWLKVLSPSILAHVGVNNPRDPLSVAEKIVGHFYFTLTDDRLAILANLTQEEVQMTFSPSTRRAIAVANANGDPEQAVRDAMVRLRGNLSDDQLVAQLGRALPRWLRIKAAVNTPRNPLVPLRRIARRLNHPSLQTDNIAKALGWGKGEVASVFTKDTLLEIAEGGAGDLSAEIRRVAMNYESTLSSANLTDELAELGIGNSEISILFTPGRRKKLALRQNPIDAARDLAVRSKELARSEGWSIALAAFVVFGSRPGKVRDLVEQIRTAQADRPQGVSEVLWAGCIAHTPRHNKDRWLQMVGAYRMWRAVLDDRRISLNYSMDESGGEGHEYSFYVRNAVPEPSALVLPSDALEYLQGLAKQTGATPNELRALLAHFEREGADGSTVEKGSKLASILEKLRQAAKNEASVA